MITKRRLKGSEKERMIINDRKKKWNNNKKGKKY